MGLGAEVIRTPEVLLGFGNTFINLASSHSGKVSGGSTVSVLCQPPSLGFDLGSREKSEK